MEKHTEFQPITGSQEAMQRFKEQGYSLVAITSRYDGLTEHTNTWIDRHFPGMIDSVHFLGRKDSYHSSKADTCKSLGVVCMIEDHLDHCLDLANHDVPTFLLERPWNRDRTEVHELITRVKEWHEITQKLAQES